MSASSYIIKCYGITKDPETNNFMLVMEYAKNGSLRQSLNKTFISMGWDNKIKILYDIAVGLSSIHREGLIHQDFHSGNILRFSDGYSRITDLGLCKPADDKSEKNVYGVLPYVAPEVLRGKAYTQASDIYGFESSFMKYLMDYYLEVLAVKICQGLRPNFILKYQN